MSVPISGVPVSPVYRGPLHSTSALETPEMRVNEIASQLHKMSITEATPAEISSSEEYPIKRAGMIPVLVTREGRTFFLFSKDGVEGFSAEYGGVLESTDITGGVVTQLREFYEETGGYFNHSFLDAGNNCSLVEDCKKNLDLLFHADPVQRKNSNIRASFWLKTDENRTRKERRGVVFLSMDVFGQRIPIDENSFEMKSLNIQHLHATENLVLPKLPFCYLERSAFRAVDTETLFKEMQTENWAVRLQIGWGRRFLEDRELWKELKGEEYCSNLEFGSSETWQMSDEEKIRIRESQLPYDPPGGVWYDLACCYKRAKVYDKAKACFYQAVEKRYPAALLYEGRKLFSEGNQLYNEKNYKRAFECFQNAVKYDHGRAQHMLGICHWYGRGTYPNLQEALRWLLLAYDNSNGTNEHPENTRLKIQEVQSLIEHQRK